MSAGITRIFSDVHYGDRASRVHTTAQLRPLLEGIDHLVLNGDTMDTRIGPNPQHTATARAEIEAFTEAHVAAATYLTGNHDPDFSRDHALELADRRILVTHGDIAFEDLVPWGRDRLLLGPLVAAELARLPLAERDSLHHRFAIWRKAAAAMPQRHQSERNPIKYAFHFAMDTVWPPLRTLHILRAWRDHRHLMATLARRHWPAAKYILIGHTHWPGIWSMPHGVTVINTGSFCPPTGGLIADIEPNRLVVRQQVLRGGEFRLGRTVAEFPL